MTRAVDLTLAEQAALTAGIDFWHTAPIDRVGIRSLRVTDGPAGARGDRWSVGTSASMPCGSALAATWNRELVRRVGRVLGDETRAKGAGVLLGPTVNIHRHPLNGRHFECFSEDPYLTSEVAVAYIEGVQERGVGAVVKHFVCNDQEHERHTISVEVSDRALREIYLPPFEAAVLRAGVWGLMGAYNRLRGTYCCEHAWLLTRLLKEELAFDGAVISDWFGTHSTPSVATGLDLEMPGPAKFLGPLLVDAVARGEVPEAAVSAAAEHVLRLLERTDGAPSSPPAETATAAARAAAAEAIVLLQNTGGVLPLEPARVRRIAVLGPQANRLSVQGGGSAEVTPNYVSSPLEAIRAQAAFEVAYEPGCVMPGPTPPLDYRWVTTGPGGAPGLQVELYAGLDATGTVVLSEVLARSLARWGGSPAPDVPAGHFSARVTAEFVPDSTATWQFGLSSAGDARLYLDDRLLVTSHEPDRFYRQGAAEVLADADLEAGSRHTLVADFRIDSGEELVGMRIGARPLVGPDAVERAVQAARDADVAVVVVGYDAGWEAEGSDRPHLDLPGDQNALIGAVAEANPRTVVVLNAGAPVSMPWADSVAAIVQLWFPGMEGGNALADVLFGDVDPCGRLPTTFPRALADTPAFASYPGQNGVARYDEGVYVGYRHYDAHNVEPRFCFGHGLSYSSYRYANLVIDSTTIRCEVTNTGPRPGREVVQLYVHSPGDPPGFKQLRDFAKLSLEPGETQPVTFTLGPRAFSHWDESLNEWRIAPGEHQILIGSSSRAIHLEGQVAP